MFNAIIVDDEKPALDVLKHLLHKTGQISVVGAFTNTLVALDTIQSLRPDVAFLDIEMHDMSGLELAEKIIDMGMDIDIVFVTAYDKYALEAFRVNAINYILKPFSSDDIAQTIARLRKVNQLSVVSQMPEDKGRIYCFGRLLVYGVGGREAIRWRTSKAEELFAFMLQNLNSEVAKWKIIQALWPECESEKQLNTYLHTTVYKMRQTLFSANIKFSLTFINGRYKMELPDVYIDTSEFETITDTPIVFSETLIERYKKALIVYKGNYLEENEYFWSQNKYQEYLTRYRSLVFEFVKYYIIKTDFTNAEKILQKALTIVPLDDNLNEMMLKLFLMKKDKASMVMHYNKIQELYESELGIAPNSSMQQLFKKTFKL